MDCERLFLVDYINRGKLTVSQFQSTHGNHRQRTQPHKVYLKLVVKKQMIWINFYYKKRYITEIVNITKNALYINFISFQVCQNSRNWFAKRVSLTQQGSWWFWNKTENVQVINTWINSFNLMYSFSFAVKGVHF